MIEVTPISFSEACEFVRQKHRNHGAPVGHKFSLAVSKGGAVCGVAIVGRPVARRLQDGWTLEVTRCATDGTRNAGSMLYRASWRAASAMGYRRLITYTLPEEGGASLRGAGFRLIGEAGGGNWNTKSRPRIDSQHQQMKLRWEVSL